MAVRWLEVFHGRFKADVDEAKAAHAEGIREGYEDEDTMLSVLVTEATADRYIEGLEIVVGNLRMVVGPEQGHQAATSAREADTAAGAEAKRPRP